MEKILSGDNPGFWGRQEEVKSPHFLPKFTRNPQNRHGFTASI